jgi:hypothetical protein
MAFRQVRRRPRPPVRAGGFKQIGAQLPSEGGFTQQPAGTPVKPSPSPLPPWAQVPATGTRQPPVTVMPERPIPDPAAQDPRQQTAGEYVQPHVAEANALAHGQTVAQVHQAAIQYATSRLAALHTIAGVAGDPQLELILSSNGNPLQVYAAASKRWAELAKAAGYADPRIWLRDMLQRAQAARPTNAQPQ